MITTISQEHFLLRLEDFRKLFFSAFKREISESFLKWRFIDNPCSGLKMIISEEDTCLTSSYSISPCKIGNKHEIVESALSMMTMTAPEYAGRGLFTLLASKLYENLELSGFQSVWGFPNANSHYSFIKKLSWQNIYELPTLNCQLAKSKSLFTQDEIVFDNQFDLVYEDVLNTGSLIQVIKTKEWLNWRYSCHPENKYTNIVISDRSRVCAFAVVKIYLGSIDIVEFQAKDEELARELVHKVISFGMNHELSNVNCWMPLHHPFHLIFERQGFFNAAPVTYFAGRSFRSLTSKSDFFDFRNWYIQMGDSDVY